MEYYKASDLKSLVKKNKNKIQSEAAGLLEISVLEAVNGMLEDGKTVTELDLNAELLPGLTLVADKLRDHEFRYCLIETEDEAGNVIGHRLRVSMAHLF